MDFAEMSGRARDVRALYAEWEVRRDGRAWSVTELMNGFTGDVGDLAKLIGAHTGSRPGPADLPTALGHELADCLWSVLVIADAVGTTSRTLSPRPWTTSNTTSAANSLRPNRSWIRAVRQSLRLGLRSRRLVGQRA